MSRSSRDWPCIQGLALRRMRTWRFMTQEELAEAVGVTRHTISDLENDNHKRRLNNNVRPLLLRRLARVLDVEPRLLCKFRDDPIPDLEDMALGLPPKGLELFDDDDEGVPPTKRKYTFDELRRRDAAGEVGPLR